MYVVITTTTRIYVLLQQSNPTRRIIFSMVNELLVHCPAGTRLITNNYDISVPMVSASPLPSPLVLRLRGRC